MKLSSKLIILLISICFLNCCKANSDEQFKVIWEEIKWFGKQKEYGQAFSRINKLVQRQEIHDSLKSNLYNEGGQMMADQTEYEQAIQMFQKSIEKNIKNSEAWNNIGNMFSLTNRIKLSYDAYEQAHFLDPKEPQILYNMAKVANSTITAISLFEKAIKLDQNYADALYEMALLKFSSNDTIGAQGALQRVLIIDPLHYEALSSLGVIQSRQNEKEEAVELFKRAKTINNQDPGLFNHLGSTYKALLLFEKAIEAFESAIELKPLTIEFHLNQADCFFQLQNFEQSIQIYRKLFSITENNHHLFHYNIGMVFFQENKLYEAQDSLIQALKLSPDFSDALFNMGVIHLRLGHKSDAEKYFKHSIEIKPEYYEVFKKLTSNEKSPDEDL